MIVSHEHKFIYVHLGRTGISVTGDAEVFRHGVIGQLARAGAVEIVAEVAVVLRCLRRNGLCHAADR